MVKKILVIKMRNLGDVLLTSSFFSVLKKTYPQAEIDACVYKDTASMLEGHPHISKILTYDKGWKKGSFFYKIFKELAFLKRIRNEKYDMVFNLTEGDRGAIIAKVSGAKIRVGVDPRGGGFFGKKSFYTHMAAMPKTPRHAVECNLDLLRRIGIPIEEDDKDLSFFISKEDQDHVEGLLLANQLVKGDYIVIHPVSRWLFKCLPIQTMAELLRKLENSGKKIVLTSSSDSLEMSMLDNIIAASGCNNLNFEFLPSESPKIYDEIGTLLPKRISEGNILEEKEYQDRVKIFDSERIKPKVQVNNIVNLGGKINLKQLGSLIQLSRCLICVDSVPLHIASALKHPTVVVFGPSSEKIWGPWKNPNCRVITSDFSCRSCQLDGCGGGKLSECLKIISAEEIFSNFKILTEIK